MQEQVSSLKVNIHKSRLVEINVSPSWLEKSNHVVE